MRTRLFLILVALGFGTAASRAQAAEPPTLILRIRSVDGILADAKSLAALVGQESAWRNIDGLIKARFPNGFSGVDTSKPLGLFASLDPTGNVANTAGALAIPVKDEQSFVKLLETAMNIEIAKDMDGVYSLPLAGGRFRLYMRLAHQYAYVSAQEKSNVDRAKLLTPAQLFPAGDASTVSVVFRLDQIPEGLKQIFLAQTELKLAALDDENRPGETPAQHALRVEAAKEVGRQVITGVRDGSEIKLRLSVNDGAGALAAEFSLAGKPGSELAGTIAGLADQPSVLGATLKPDAVLRLRIHALLSESLGKAIQGAWSEGFERAAAGEKDAARRQLVQKVGQALKSGLKTDELDVAGSVQGPNAQNHYRFVAGLRVKDAAAIDQAIYDVLKDVSAKGQGTLKNYALQTKPAGGGGAGGPRSGIVLIHDFQAKQLEKEPARVLGSNSFLFARKDDVLLVAAGQDALDALDEVLLGEPKSAAMGQFAVHVNRLVPLSGNEARARAEQAAKKAFGNETEKDQISLTLHGGKELRLRLRIDAAVIKFFRIAEDEKSSKLENLSK
jgi:hypothetical protein